jgi:hypothetical protein
MSWRIGLAPKIFKHTLTWDFDLFCTKSLLDEKFVIMIYSHRIEKKKIHTVHIRDPNRGVKRSTQLAIVKSMVRSRTERGLEKENTDTYCLW